jgi:hypothetical protein
VCGFQGENRRLRQSGILEGGRLWSQEGSGVGVGKEGTVETRWPGRGFAAVKTMSMH